MYSEHLVARLLGLTRGRHSTGADLDARLGRRSVTVGRLIAPRLGGRPSDESLVWITEKLGESCPVGTRGALHILADGRTGLGLGAGRGVIESAGDHLAVVVEPEGDRYDRAYRLPGVEYGGLL